MKHKAQMKLWIVPAEVTMRGYAVVEAESAEKAENVVRGGGFDLEPGAEITDWDCKGQARPNE